VTNPLPSILDSRASRSTFFVSRGGRPLAPGDVFAMLSAPHCVVQALVH
jgi:hypothetical protein